MRSKGSLFSHNNLQTASFFSVLDGYRQLMPRFDTRLIFSGRGQDRNKLIIMHTIDVALHHCPLGMRNRHAGAMPH